MNINHNTDLPSALRFEGVLGAKGRYEQGSPRADSDPRPAVELRLSGSVQRVLDKAVALYEEEEERLRPEVVAGARRTLHTWSGLSAAQRERLAGVLAEEL
jgi:hypothetical protein